MGQLNQMQRYAISLMLREKKTQCAIAEAIGVNKSTISRELKRNSTNGRYHYKTAQELCEIRKERLREPRKFNGEIKNRIDRKLREEDWSPEQSRQSPPTTGTNSPITNISPSISRILPIFANLSCVLFWNL